MDNFLPLNLQIFLETVLGKQTPITEKNLLPQDKEKLKEVIRRKQQANLDREFSLQNSLYDTPQEFRRGSPTKLEETTDGRYISVPQSYTEHQDDIKRQLASFEKTRGKTSVSYGDYGVASGENAAPVGQSWGSMLKQSIDDPAFRLAGTLGSFNAYDTPTGTRVEDTYGFDKDQEWFYRGAVQKPTWKIVQEYYDRPGSLGEILYRKYLGNRSRPVNIQLDK